MQAHGLNRQGIRYALTGQWRRACKTFYQGLVLIQHQAATAAVTSKDEDTLSCSSLSLSWNQVEECLFASRQQEEEHSYDDDDKIFLWGMPREEEGDHADAATSLQAVIFITNLAQVTPSPTKAAALYQRAYELVVLEQQQRQDGIDSCGARCCLLDMLSLFLVVRIQSTPPLAVAMLAAEMDARDYWKKTSGGGSCSFPVRAQRLLHMWADNHHRPTAPSA